jgi:hypothetical protein
MSERMAIVNPSKALVALVAMVCITILMALEKIATEEDWLTKCADIRTRFPYQ